MWWAPILGAIAGQAASSLFADNGGDVQGQRDYAAAQADKNAELQREFAKHGIQWRMEDAKAAGVHPMYALSGGGAAFSPNPIHVDGSGPSRSSFNIGGAVERALDNYFKGSGAGTVLARGDAVSSIPYQSDDYRWDVDYSGGPRIADVNLQNLVDVAQYKPVEVLSRRSEDPSLTRGDGPGGSVHTIAPGFRMILPSSPSGGTSEALEALGESWELAYAYVQRNVDEYGVEWLDKAQRFLPFTATLAKVVNNVRNALTWANEPGLTELGHRTLPRRAMEILDRGRGPTVSGRIRYR